MGRGSGWIRRPRSAPALRLAFIPLAFVVLLSLACGGTPGAIATSTQAAATPVEPAATATRPPARTATPPPPTPSPRPTLAPPTPRPTATHAAQATTAAPAPAGGNPFGVLLAARVLGGPNGMGLLRDLGVAYFRPPSALRIASWDGTCRPCDAATAAGLKLILTVSNSGGNSASAPPQDLEAYRRTLGEILDKYPPAILAVENEENSSVFYTGTPEQYGAELKTACAVAHAKSIPCTNGGMVSTLVAFLVYDDYVRGGQGDRAQNFAARAFTPEQQRLLPTAGFREQVAKGQALLGAYRAAGMDYMNFHWYIGDPAALAEAVAYLRAQTGLPVLTNEIGQDNNDPAQTRAILQKVLELRLPVAVWFGMDGPKAKGLVELNGELRPTGRAFRDFMHEHWGS